MKPSTDQLVRLARDYALKPDADALLALVRASVHALGREAREVAARGLMTPHAGGEDTACISCGVLHACKPDTFFVGLGSAGVLCESCCALGMIIFDEQRQACERTLSADVVHTDDGSPVLIHDIRGLSTRDVIWLAYTLGVLVGSTPSMQERSSGLGVGRPKRLWRLALHGVPAGDLDAIRAGLRQAFKARQPGTPVEVGGRAA